IFNELIKNKTTINNNNSFLSESPDSAFCDSFCDIPNNNWNELFNYLRKEIVI
uniref:Uncharacterized protein n=1 Tax=Meloidogyne hapla TaxID=6305 RepID=A0A1I8BH82_MELHA